MIPLKIHNVVDYLAGAFLIVSPWLFNFAQAIEARTLFLGGGLLLIATSLLTNDFFSLARRIPLGVHMTADTLLGLLLILAPALFGYREQITEAQYAAHVAIGAGLVGFVALTRPRTEKSKTAADRAAIEHDLPIMR